MKKYTFWSLFLALLLLCSGCYAEVPQAENNDPHAVDHPEVVSGQLPAPWLAEHSFTQDNATACSTVGIYPSSNGKGYYFGSKARYYDIAQQTAMSICAKPGCEHNNESCPSSVGALSMIESDGMLYDFCEVGGSLELLKVDSRTGERKSLYHWDAESEDYYLNAAFYSSGHIYVTLLSYKEEGGALLQAIDLASEKLVTLAQCTDRSYGRFLGAYDRHALIDWTTLSEAPLTMEEYLAQKPNQTEDDYFNSYLDDFHNRHSRREVRLYDVEDGSFTDLTELLQLGRESIPNMYLASDFSSGCHGPHLIYLLDQTICLYDFTTNQARTLFEEPNLCMAQLADGRLIYLTRPQDGQLHLYAYHLETGEAAEIYNDGNQEVMAFSIDGETAETFVGIYCKDGNFRNGWIYKDDFYAGCYENVVFS